MAAETRPEEVERAMHALWVGVPNATLRRADRKKAIEVAAMMNEIRRALPGGTAPVTLVDAAAGKAYVGLLAAQLVLAPLERASRVLTLEREPERVALTRTVARNVPGPATIECRAGDVADPALWPAEPEIVAALHACGTAADAIIDRALGARARTLLLVPCCTSDRVAAAACALGLAATIGVPRHAPVRRRFVQAIVDAERTLRLEAAGWQTEVVELCPPTVTPHNLLWRARRVNEPGRMAKAATEWARLTSEAMFNPG